MTKDPERLLLTPKTWVTLPPRRTTDAQLFDLIGGKPKKITGFCQDCSSRIVEEWCTADSIAKVAHEIRHFADEDIAILRPSELALIQKILL